jgi:hypothetical protein
VAYTLTDVTAIEKAITEFIAGDRKSSVSFRDGRSIAFANASLMDLQTVRRNIIAEVNRKTRVRTSVFSTSKGL